MIEVSIPSKTFIVGEYAILQGAPALLAATTPSFRFTAEKKIDAMPEGAFHARSPAGCWFRQSKILLKDWDVKFTDPHHGRGGFGASGAQFVFYHSLATYLQSELRVENVADVLQDYKVCDSSGGSGADVVTQVLGGVTTFNVDPFEAQSVAWPFADMDFVIIRTGAKTDTHTHIKNMKFGDTKAFLQADEIAVAAFLDGDLESFLAETSTFQNELIKLGLQAEKTKEILKSLNGLPGLVLAKGCGAMGADTIMAFVEKTKLPEFLEQMKHKNLEVIATTKDLAPPLRLEMVN